MPISIPTQLKNEKFRFVKVKSKTKEPSETGWQNLNYTYKDAQVWLSQGNNCGIVSGHGDLLIIDADHKEISALVERCLSETFSVLTGSGKKHYYFFCKQCKDFPKKAIGLNKGDIHFGEIRAYGVQTIAPGSIHPDTLERYEVDRDIVIATIDKDNIITLLRDYIAVRDLVVESIYASGTGQSYAFKNPLNSILTILPKDIKLEKISEFGYRGTHPIHGSETGQNFCVNIKDNVFYCFRHNAGGGILHLIAQTEKIISCGETLEGANFKKTLEVAREKYGVYHNALANKESLDDISKKEVLPLKFYIKDFIAEQQRVIIAGDNETLKTMLALNMTVTMQCGLDQLFENTDKFPVIKTNVLYIDAERIQRGRDLRIKAMIESKNLKCDTDIFVNPDDFDLAEKDSRLALERAIIDLELKVIIIDSIEYAWSGEEIDQVGVGELLSYFRNLVDKYQITIVLIKHNKKPQADKYIEPKHMIAGSHMWSDWADNIICMTKNASKQIVVSQVKHRSTGTKFNNFIVASTDTCWLKYVSEFSTEERTSGEEVRPLFEKVGKNEVTIKDLETAAQALNLGLSTDQIRGRLRKATKAGIVQKVNKDALKGTAGIFKLTGKTEDSVESDDFFTKEPENES